MSGTQHQLGDAARGPTPCGGASTATASALPSFSASTRRRMYDPSTTLEPSTEVTFTLNQHTHPDLLLRDAAGALVIDPDWDEVLLDVRTPSKRAALAAIVGGWIATCAADGFDAIEIDNLDTYSRSSGLVSEDDAVTFMRMLADIAHAAGLPIAQKNSAEVLPRRGEMDTDFAIVEECNRFSECGDFTAVYGSQVYVIEYRRADFDAGCRDFPELSIVLRDLDLSAPGAGAYVYDGC